MGYTLSPASLSAGVTPTGPYDYSGRNIATLPTIDPAAAGTQNHPMHKLVIQYFLSGKWPLWNPYQAAGTPLAADTVFSAYAPVNLLHFLPSELWDIPILLRLWLAGLFTYVFQKNHKTSKESAFVGAVLYMLSGAFTWYISMDHLNVIMLMPLLLLAVDRLVMGKKASDICLASFAIMLSLLGAHIESIILQFILVLFYYVFRVIGTNAKFLLARTLRFMLSFAIGIGLSAFFLLPVFEYLANSSLGHGPGSGLGALLPYAAITSFVPYFFGQVQTYMSPAIRQAISWDSLGGYVGVSPLYLCLIAIIPLSTIKFDKNKQRFALFFFAMAIIALLKTYGVQPVQWIAHLPVLELIAFTRYLGPIWAFSFSMVAAIGFEKLLCEPQKKILLIAFGAASLTIVTLAFMSIPFPLTPGSLSFSHSTEKLVITLVPLNFFYSMEKLVEGFVFLFTITFLSLALLKDRKMLVPLIGLVVLEMAFYIPQGMSYQGEVRRSLIALSTLAVLVIIMVGRKAALSDHLSILKSVHKCWMRFSTRNVLLLVILISLVAQNVVAGLSPEGLPQRSNAFQQAPYISFLQRNSGFSRVYTFDYVLPPPYAGVFGLYQMGTYTAFNVGTYHSFAKRNLDSGFLSTVVASNEWFREPNAPGPVAELHRNIEFYNFLGVRYIVTKTTDPNYAPEIVGGDLAIPLDNPQTTIGQSFMSIVNNLSSIAIQLGTYGRKNHGSIILTLDSIPYKEEYHRTVVLSAEGLCDSWPPTIFNFEPIDDSRGRQFHFTIQFPQANSTNAIAVWSYSEMHPYARIVREVVKGHLNVNGKPFGGNIVFAISSGYFRLVYNDDIARVYENPNVFPRVFIVHRFQVASSFELAQNIVRNPDFNLREWVVLDASLPESEVEAIEQTCITDYSWAEIIRYEPDRVVIKAYAEHPGLLVLTDTYYPGWKAYVDGKPTIVYQADGLVRAVYLGEGEHIVEFIYFPESFNIGLTITITTICALLAVLAIDTLHIAGLCRQEKENSSVVARNTWSRPR
jgi:hypothetical protein